MQLSPRAEAAGFGLISLESVGSTNSHALAHLKPSGHSGLWVVAKEQISGRGRLGRHWHSPEGNLYASLALSNPCAMQDSAKLGFAAALALHQAISPYLIEGQNLRLKWPNDLLLNGAKLSGILLEGQSLGRAQELVIGMGVNILHHPENLEQPVTSLMAQNIRLSREELFLNLCNATLDMLALFDHGRGFAAIRALWLSHALPLGTEMRIRNSATIEAGRFAGMDEAGRLLLEQGAAVKVFEVGDVLLAQS